MTSRQLDYEPVLLPIPGRTTPVTPRGVPGRRRLRGLAQGAQEMTPGRGRRRSQGGRPARSRRRRLPGRHQVELRAEDRPAPKYMACQRRRVRAGHLQRPRDHGDRAAHADRGRGDRARYAIGAETAFIYIRGEYVERGRPAGSGDRRGRSARACSGEDVPRDAGQRARSTSSAARAPTSAARRRRCWSRSKGGARCRARARRSRPSRGCTAARRCINNVETLANVPHIIDRGSEWYNTIGVPPRNTGPKIFCLSGRVNRARQLRAAARRGHRSAS